MKTVVIPDVHEKIHLVIKVIEKEYDANRFVFIGDWWDRFPSEEGSIAGTAAWLCTNASNKSYTFLWGNHDMPYCFPFEYLQCSRFSNNKKNKLVRNGATLSMKENFVLATRVGKYVVSHAGIHPNFAKNVDAYIGFKLSLEYVMQTPFELQAGVDRGGRALVGGLTWLDWNRGFEETPGMPQIVGHTADWEDFKVRRKGESICLDTNLKHYAVVVDDLDAEIKEV